MRLLLSTHACVPTQISEPGNAWRLINDLLPEHEVWAVIETLPQQQLIQNHLADHPMPGFHPVYLTLSPVLKKLLHGQVTPLHAVYYHLWQEKLAGMVRELHRRVGFDVSHHVTFGRYWSPSGLRALDVPFVWGPVGTAETPPRPFVSELPLQGRLFEIARDQGRYWCHKGRAVRATARAATIGIGVTRETCEALRSLGVRRVKQMPQAAFTDAELATFDGFPPPPSGPLRAICMGRLLHWKGFHLAIRAFAAFAKANPDAELWIVNTGPFQKELEKTAAQSGIRSQVIFLGQLATYAEVLQKLAQSHVLMHPALHEGFGNVCLEALAAGRPVVCIDIGGPATLVSPDTGFTAPATTPSEAVEAMAAFLFRIHRDRSLLAQMSANARARVREHFTMRSFGREIRASYREAVALHSPSGGRIQMTSDSTLNE